MKTKTHTSQILLLASALSLATACSNSEFASSPAATTATDSRSGDKPDGLPKSGIGSDKSDPSKNGGGSSGGGDTDDPFGQGGGGGSGNNNRDLDKLVECLKRKAADYNVVLVLDNSSSQTSSDKQRVRQAVALDFASRFNELVRRKPDTVVQLAVISFWAQASALGWTRLDGKDDAGSNTDLIDTLKAHIKEATENEKGGTNFANAFNAAQKSFEDLGDSRFNTNVKNYVIFMTDGEPYPASSFDLPTIRSTIVDANKAAILAIASGSSIKSQGIDVVKSLALPQDREPKGGYYRAATAEDMKSVWDKVFVDLIDCK